MCGITTARERQSCIVQFIERSKDTGCLPTVTASVPFLKGLCLVVQRNGKICLQDVVNRAPVCFLMPPTTHLLATPCSPIFALNNKQQTLFVQGDSDPIGSPNGTCQCDLFVFHFTEPDIIRPYVVSLSESPKQPETMSFAALEKACDLYLHQRALSMA
ncbi:WD repeat-containing protein 93-like [Thalassophryne amazonica]|uniref:WD repeat-containing protein 93-like n=1 Tax=Thalassophryne amazonica TaxID=390379 RepID=UPI001471EE46|nr:WD repeat-containing protein 93-like [Thalassophryne amazonica]